MKHTFKAPMGVKTFTVMYFDLNWCEIPELTRRYLKPGEVVKQQEWFVDLWVKIGKGIAVELPTDALPIGMDCEVSNEQA